MHGRQVGFPGFDAATARKRTHDKVVGEDVALGVDLVLIAIGFTGAERRDPLFEQLSVQFGQDNTIRVDSHATSVPGVFAAGDCVLGADLIVSAIAQGRECARSVDRYLRGETRLPSRDFVRSVARFDAGPVGLQPS
jgi:NADPH-dependent glutamate synthase beta subunit-like oxidoreductase